VAHITSLRGTWDAEPSETFSHFYPCWHSHNSMSSGASYPSGCHPSYAIAGGIRRLWLAPKLPPSTSGYLPSAPTRNLTHAATPMGELDVDTLPALCPKRHFEEPLTRKTTSWCHVYRQKYWGYDSIIILQSTFCGRRVSWGHMRVNPIPLHNNVMQWRAAQSWQ